MKNNVQVNQWDSNSRYSIQDLAQFLFTHLERFGDPLDQIEGALDYAQGKNNKPGGALYCATMDNELVGVVVFLKTGMEGFIPSNILVYIAVDGSKRGAGIGAKLIEFGVSQCSGGVALHVEPDNPAKRLYERLGFMNKYLEMRLS